MESSVVLAITLFSVFVDVGHYSLVVDLSTTRKTRSKTPNYTSTTMIAYLFRRLLYAIPTLIGINVITFALFFMVNSPDDMARMQLGEKYVKQAEIDQWKRVHGYHDPLFYNSAQRGMQRMTQTLFFQKSLRLF